MVPPSAQDQSRCDMFRSGAGDNHGVDSFDRSECDWSSTEKAVYGGERMMAQVFRFPASMMVDNTGRQARPSSPSIVSARGHLPSCLEWASDSALVEI